MANIYEPKSEDLHSLIDRASNVIGAEVVIPDLQRPYVWDPAQVSLLIDSLIRGWPFGTLLMWKVQHNDLAGIPHREFWQVVDRTSSAVGATVNRRDPPASYHMVLDGQQRVQSLLLALCGDGWGFKQEDRLWLEQLEGIRPRGRRPTNPHWSKGTLCFDIPRFLDAYATTEDIIGIDYRDILKWVITDPNGGQSTWSKPQNYREPLTRSFASENSGRFVRLSRLWSVVPANANIRERQFKELAQPLLEEHGVTTDVINQVLDPMGELMSVLRDVKLSKITYLELKPFDEAIWTQDEYNEAIVNIFTRLNTAGRTLTREEITFAWLKVGWDDSLTERKTAGDCFEELLNFARDGSLPVDSDDIVRGVSFLWACGYRSGTLLSDKDLLKGDTVRPMARDLSSVWAEVVESLKLVLETAKERDLRYGQNGQYNSLNALIVVWYCAFNALRWLKSNPQNTVRTDSFQKSLKKTLEVNLDRWMICSQWAGRWSSSKSMPDYAKDLASDQVAISACTNPATAITVIESRFRTLNQGVVGDAEVYVNHLTVDRREQVARYNTMLWVWHRLDDERWKASQIPLRSGRQRTCDLEVDHTVAHALWETKINAMPVVEGEDDLKLALRQIVNNLGNCTLLEKSFNISKSAKQLSDFLENVHEFETEEITIEQWSANMGLEVCLLKPNDYSVDEIQNAIADRELKIRSELVEFVRGDKQRKDLAVAENGEVAR
jgi:hypothetical protein